MHNALLVSSTTTSSRHPWPIHKVLAQNLDLFQLPFHLFRGLLSGPVVSTLLGLGRNSYTSERLGYVPQHKRYSRRLTEMRGPTVDLSTPFRPTQSHGRWNLPRTVEDNLVRHIFWKGPVDTLPLLPDLILGQD